MKYEQNEILEALPEFVVNYSTSFRSKNITHHETFSTTDRQ